MNEWNTVEVASGPTWRTSKTVSGIGASTISARLVARNTLTMGVKEHPGGACTNALPAKQTEASTSFKETCNVKPRENVKGKE